MNVIQCSKVPTEFSKFQICDGFFTKIQPVTTLNNVNPCSKSPQLLELHPCMVLVRAYPGFRLKLKVQISVPYAVIV